MKLIKLIFLLTLLFSTSNSFATERITVYGQRITFELASAFIGISWGSGEYSNPVEENSRPADVKSEICSKVNKNKPAGCTNSVNIASNGCTSSGLGGDWDSTFNSACNGHDECYTSIGAVKGNCDSAFYGDMKDICNAKFSKNGVKNLTCHGSAIAYSKVVSVAPAFMYFNPAQSDLKCVIWKKLREKACSAIF